MSKWNGLERRITAFDALNEPIEDQLFGPSYEARQRQIRARAIEPTTTQSFPWKKPRIERSKREPTRGRQT